MSANILIISPSWLGDLIMSHSLLQVLKQQDPSCRITLYAPAFMHPIITRMKEADAYLENPFAHGALRLRDRFKEGRHLAELNFDRAFVLPNSFKSALIPFFAGIKERIAFKGESRYVIVNRMRSDKEAFPLMVQRYAALAYDRDQVKSAAQLPPYPFPKLKVNPPAAALLDRLKLKLDRPLLALGCGANYGPSKLWPPEYFAAVCDEWIRRGGAVLALGSPKDGETVKKIASCLKPESAACFHDIAGQTNLIEALDLVGACTGAVCNDSGMMHTVAAAGVPQVCIFGSTSTGYTPPLSAQAVCVESDEPCHPCFRRTCKFNTYACQKGILPQTVMDRLFSLTGV